MYAKQGSRVCVHEDTHRHTHAHTVVSRRHARHVHSAMSRTCKWYFADAINVRAPDGEVNQI